MEEDEEEEYLVPLQDQSVFGAGIKRKRVPFVPATSDSPLSANSITSQTEDRYLSIVLPDAGLGKTENSLGDGLEKIPEATFQGPLTTVSSNNSAEHLLCEICRLPMASIDRTTISSAKPHEASLAHQVCLSHSHPPSHLDRKRLGLKCLSSYGWDPDSRLGLGAAGVGIRVPIKVKLKNNTLGLGIKENSAIQKRPEKTEKLDAKQVRRKEKESRRKQQKLQELFYRNDDVENYSNDPYPLDQTTTNSTKQQERTMSLRIAPAPAHPTSTTNLSTSTPNPTSTKGAPSAPGIHDTLRANLSSAATPGSTSSAHPLEARLAGWQSTQDSLKMASLRRTFGIAEPVRRGMELKIARAGEWRPQVLGGSAGVSGDVLAGRDLEITWEDVYRGDETREGVDFHAEMEGRFRMDW